MKLWPRRFLAGSVRAYRLLFGAWTTPSCRFVPSCSQYALEALEQHGACAGSVLTVARIARCAPWCRGCYDPVPAQPPRLFTRWLQPAPFRSASDDASSTS
ncbi:MAG: membrane protein insertion efficiency factor YidD [Pseudomonadota bacterium]|nr:membrane protein insertion efficiency factor YidD [Pseudomonadota bacterium]